MKPFLSAFAFVLQCLLVSPSRAETVTVYTSAKFAPLVIDDTRGLYVDLVNYLNHQKLGNLRFKLAFIPRKRLQVKLEEGSIDGIVIGMMPQWFDDAAQTKYLWTVPFAWDNFILVSNRGTPVDSETPSGLAGKTVGLTLGYVYPGIDRWIAINLLQRQDAQSESINIEKLLLGRVDCIVVSQTVINYYIKSHGLQNKFAFGQVPGQLTERRFLIPLAYRHVHEKLAPLMRKLNADPAWQAIVKAY